MGGAVAIIPARGGSQTSKFSQNGLTGVVTLLCADEADGAAPALGETCKRLGLRWCHAPLNGPTRMGFVAGASKKKGKQGKSSSAAMAELRLMEMDVASLRTTREKTIGLGS